MVEVSVKKVVGYIRVSSENQKENTSMDQQIKEIENYCKYKKIKLVKIFKDEAKSGGKIEGRNSYLEMIDFITDNKNSIDGLVVYKADRIHRSIKNLFIMIEDILEPNNIAFISTSQDFDTSTAVGKMFLSILGTFSEFERNTINERTKGGRIATANKGKYAGGEPPFGYKVDNGELAKDEEAALIIERIFTEYVEGLSMNKIAKGLNSDGLKTKTNKDWKKSSIAYILNNEIYTGTYTYDGVKEKNNIVNKNQVESIISKQLWNKVQSFKRERVKNKK